MLSHPIEHTRAVKLVRRGLAGFYAPGQLLPAANVPVVRKHHRHMTDTRFGVRSKRLGQRSLRKTPVLLFREHADARIGTKQPVQRALLRSSERSQLFGALGP